MDESDLQNRCRTLRNLFMYVNVEEISVDRLKDLVKSVLDDENLHDILRVYTHSYSSYLLKTEYLGVLVDEIAEKARENISDIKRFSLDSFICSKCNEIIHDPVTLKCGHTFSKKCVLSETIDDSFNCTECNQTYTFSYISQLKNNVAILSLVEKLSDRYLKHKGSLAATSENNQSRIYDIDTYLISSKENQLLSEVEHSSLILHATTSSGYFKKGNILFNFGNLKEALKAYLICFSLDSNALHSKRAAIEVLRMLLQNKKSQESTDGSLRSSGSSDSLHITEDDRSSSDEDDTKFDLTDYYQIDLHGTLRSFFDYMKQIRDENTILSRIDVSSLDKREFECPLCMRILWEPVTTTCGHTFCRVCLNRCFDHQATCPLCKASLSAFLADRVQNTTEFLERAIKNLFPTDFAERQAVYLEEMEELTNAGKDPEHEIPLFVCTVALPTVPCPLHVFEPRYRLMIRQCMESGSRQFGMCGVVDDEIAEFGTMLEIRDVQYFPDGRSIVDTVGRKRFRILRRGERDGYHTGAIEFLEDQSLSDVDLQCIEEKHDRTYKISKVWFLHLPADTRHQILQHFGPMPNAETNYTSSPDGPSWLWWMLAILPVETRLKVLLLSLTSLPRRLEFLYRILLHFQSAILS